MKPRSSSFGGLRTPVSPTIVIGYKGLESRRQRELPPTLSPATDLRNRPHDQPICRTACPLGHGHGHEKGVAFVNRENRRISDFCNYLSKPEKLPRFEFRNSCFGFPFQRQKCTLFNQMLPVKGSTSWLRLRSPTRADVVRSRSKCRNTQTPKKVRIPSNCSGSKP